MSHLYNDGTVSKSQVIVSVTLTLQCTHIAFLSHGTSFLSNLFLVSRLSEVIV